MRVLTRATSIRLRSETHQQLQQIAHRERIPPAQLMRSALGAFIDGYLEKCQRDVASLAIGEVDAC